MQVNKNIKIMAKILDFNIPNATIILLAWQSNRSTVSDRLMSCYVFRAVEHYSDNNIMCLYFIIHFV